MATKPEKAAKIGRRIERLLKTCDDSRELNLTSSIDTAEKAERLALLKITEYRDDRHKPIARNEITDKTKLHAVWYQLTEAGIGLREQLISGAIKVKDTQRDEDLSWLLEQSACLHFEKTAEPHNSYTWDTEPRFLVNLANQWIKHAASRLQISLTERHHFVYADHDCYDSPERHTGLFCEAIASEDNCSIDITVALYHPLGLFNYPVILTLELNVRKSAREFFRRATADYPKIVSDILEYGSSLRFQCHVPLSDEPKGRRPPTIDWFKAYFAPGEKDDEEHFFLETQFIPTSTHAHIRRNFLAVLALYEGALNSLGHHKSQDLLLDYHSTLGLRRR
jgi:hypothetical protein